MERIARKDAGSYLLSVATLDDDEASVTVDTSPAVEVFDGAGASVYTGTPTPATGSMSISVPYGELPELDVYRCVWTGLVGATAYSWVTFFELVGGHYFSVADLRAFDDSLSAAKYPVADVKVARRAAERRFELAARRSFVLRGARHTAIGNGTTRLLVPDSAVSRLIAATRDGTALTAEQVESILVLSWGAFDWPPVEWSQFDFSTYAYSTDVWTADKVCTVHYEHGESSPPEPVAQAVMMLAREYLVRKSLSSRATVEATEVGFFRLSVAGRDRPTGIPEVDEVIREFGRRRPKVR